MLFILDLLLWTINKLNFDTLSGISVQIIWTLLSTWLISFLLIMVQLKVCNHRKRGLRTSLRRFRIKLWSLNVTIQLQNHRNLNFLPKLYGSLAWSKGVVGGGNFGCFLSEHGCRFISINFSLFIVFPSFTFLRWLFLFLLLPWHKWTLSSFCVWVTFLTFDFSLVI